MHPQHHCVLETFVSDATDLLRRFDQDSFRNIGVFDIACKWLFSHSNITKSVVGTLAISSSWAHVFMSIYKRLEFFAMTVRFVIDSF
jgi:hypothetical protein